MDPSGHRWEENYPGGGNGGGGGGGGAFLLGLLGKALSVVQQYGQRLLDWGFNYLVHNPDVVNGTVQEPDDVVGGVAFDVGGKLFSRALRGGGTAIGKILKDGTWVQLGEWRPRSVHMSDAARAYQQYVTGAEEGWEFFRNGVHFDGALIDDAGELVLIDAKLATAGANSFYSKLNLDFAERKVLNEARAQLKAADGLQVIWYVSDETAAAALKDLFERRKINITIQYAPWNP